MNKHKPYRKQTGFFDLGLSLAILVIFGTTAFAVQSERTIGQAKHIVACEEGQQEKNQEDSNCKES